MFRREVFDEVGGYKVDPVNLEDWDFWVSAGAANFKFMHLARPLFRYRIHARSETFRDLKFTQYMRENEIVTNTPDIYHPTEVQAAAKLLGRPVTIEVPEGPKVVVMAHTQSVGAYQEMVSTILEQTYRPSALTVVSECVLVQDYVSENPTAIPTTFIKLEGPEYVFETYNDPVLYQVYQTSQKL